VEAVKFSKKWLEMSQKFEVLGFKAILNPKIISLKYQRTGKIQYNRKFSNFEICDFENDPPRAGAPRGVEKKSLGSLHQLQICFVFHTDTYK